jgi:tRNA uridine 5-carbamoylmethylation protein Kti12
MNNTITILGELSGLVQEFNEHYCIVKIQGTNDCVKFYRYDFENHIENEWLWELWEQLNQNNNE